MPQTSAGHRGETIGIVGFGFVVLGWIMVAAEVELPAVAGWGALAIGIGLALLIAALVLGERTVVTAAPAEGSSASQRTSTDPR